MLVVRERGLRTNPKTKVDAIAWWIDFGAITHVCKDRCWFKTYEPVKDKYVLYMVDDHFAPVYGKGSVVLKFSSGKSITLFNVLYVPKLHKNLISGPVLNKCGYKQVYESDKYILSKSGVFVGFGYYNNVMFMLNLNKVSDDSNYVYMSSSTVVNSSLWHVRLGYVHYKRMLEMSKDDLIPVIDENQEKSPYTPQQNDVAERKNRALKEMVNSILSYSGLSEGFWGEAMLMACYLLNMVHNKRNKTTTYELWFYDIEPNESVFINSIIESRDAIFDENRFSSIPRPKDVIPNSDESQRDDHSNDVPSETSEPRRGCKWIFKRKMKVDGTIDKFKARLIIQGFRQKEGIDYFDTYAPVARITTIRLLLALAAIHNLVIHQMDVKTTFLNGDLEDEVYMKQPKGFFMPGNEHKKILKKFNREDCSSVSTPMDLVEKLKPNTGKPVDQLEYSRAIGCLMYAMTSTRLNIAYAIGRLSRFTSNPSRQHWHAITTASKKQTCITGSTMESKFIALAAAGKEAEWLRNLIHEIPIWPKPITPISIHCDGAATLAKAYSQMYNGKSRHLGVKHSMIRELIMNGVISIEFVWSQHNLADHLTKGLAKDLVVKSVIGMGLKSI
ncbi:zinc finger, CCHC-type containing protein [Tanacetum coccineum]